MPSPLPPPQRRRRDAARRVSRVATRVATWLSALAIWLLVAAPGIARACAVCTAGREEENQLAYLLTTIFMSLMPLFAIGTLVFVLWRRIRKLEAEREAEPRSEPGRAATGS